MVQNLIDSHFAMKFKPKAHSLAPNNKEGIGALKWDYDEFFTLS
jgi:hypothetical protein